MERTDQRRVIAPLMPGFMLSNLERVQAIGKIAGTKTIIEVIGSFHLAIHIPGGLCLLPKALAKEPVIKTGYSPGLQKFDHARQVARQIATSIPDLIPIEITGDQNRPAQ